MSCPYFRLATVAGHVAPHPVARPAQEEAQGEQQALALCPVAGLPSFTPAAGLYVRELKAARSEILALLDEINCNPILVRLAWHDSGTYDCTVAAGWPSCGGANGSIRFAAELGHGANAGLAKGINVYLAPIKKRHPAVSWADLIQLGSACAVRHAGGPRIPMRYGRIDTASEAQCPAAGNLPGAMAPFDDGSPDAATHLRRVFYRMGFNDEAIVALSGAHTLGRAWKERSGTTEHGVTNPTAYTAKNVVARPDGKPGVGLPGGQSWTKNWLTFDNSYFQPAGGDAALLRLPTDSVLATDPGFKPFYAKFGASQPAFFASYAKAHKQLSELGSAFMPAEGFVLDD